jgi:ferredoxin
MRTDLTDAEALAAGQDVRCAICGQCVGPCHFHRLIFEDGVMCSKCGDVGLLRESLVGGTVFTYAGREQAEGRNAMSNSNEAWTARRHQHCMDCCPVSVPYIPYHCRGVSPSPARQRVMARRGGGSAAR